MASIKTENQYKSALSRIDELFFATDENTPENDPRLVELNILSAQVEEYEKEHFPIPKNQGNLEEKKIGKSLI